MNENLVCAMSSMINGKVFCICTVTMGRRETCNDGWKLFCLCLKNQIIAARLCALLTTHVWFCGWHHLSVPQLTAVMTSEAPHLGLVAFSHVLGLSSINSLAWHELGLMQNACCVNTDKMFLAIAAFLELMLLEATLPRTVVRGCRKTGHFWNAI